jgi:hypothetical protein
MPQRKTESRFLKRSGRRASSSGLGGRSFGVENLLQLGASRSTIKRFRSFIDAHLPVNRAIKLAIYETDRSLYDQIQRCRDDAHPTFRSQMRVYLSQQGKSPGQ